MSSREYRIAMYETYVTRAMIFGLFAVLARRDRGLSPEFWIMTAAAISNVIAAAWMHWRKAH